MAGDSWSITLPENLAARPIVQTVADEDGKCPILVPEFLQEILSLPKDRADKVHGEIPVGRPRRSTKPDQNGIVCHPLWGCVVLLVLQWKDFRYPDRAKPWVWRFAAGHPQHSLLV